MSNEPDRLSHALRVLADREGTSTPPVESLLRRGRRSRRNRTVGRSAAVVGAVAIVGAAAAIGVGNSGTGQGSLPGADGRGRHGTGSAAPARSSPPPATSSPPMRLVAAMRKTNDTSFRVRSYADYDSRAEDCTGGYDPKRRVSWMAVPNGEVYIITIGDDIYERSPTGAAGSHEWAKLDLSQYPKSQRPPLDSFYCGGTSVARAQVLDDMQKEGPIRYIGRRTRDGRTFDVYSVTSTRPVIGDGSYDTTQAWVNVKSGYVEQLWSWEAPKGAKAAPSVIIYSHFGEPVTVRRPTN